MTESATNLADLAVRPTYEQVLQSINHSEVQGLLRDAQADERRLNRELEHIEQDEDLTTEARERKAQELIDRFSPRISEGYARAKRMIETSAESSYRFSLPFPEGKTFAQAGARGTGELLAVQGEAEAMAAKIYLASPSKR